jgi:hypothetical protein
MSSTPDDAVVIGVEFGTLPGRALVVQVADGALRELRRRARAASALAWSDERGGDEVEAGGREGVGL